MTRDTPHYLTTPLTGGQVPDSDWIPASERERLRTAGLLVRNHMALEDAASIWEDRFNCVRASHAVADAVIAELVAALRLHDRKYVYRECYCDERETCQPCLAKDAALAALARVDALNEGANRGGNHE